MLKITKCFQALFITIIISLLCTNNSLAQVDKLYLLRTVAFYNVENLFDTENDPFIFDDDRTPTGKDKWTLQKYEHKLKNLSKVIAEIGGEISQLPPAILGLCEVENLKVLEDLVNQPALISYNYGIIHYDSPDSRGIDVGLIYQKDLFIPQQSQSRRLLMYEADDPSKRVYTRDQLVVSGLFEGEPMHFIVNHWPSRSGGEARSSYKRESAARLNRKIIDSLHRIDPYAKIMIMGDFNDDPNNKSIRKVLGAKADKSKTGIGELFNPMENMLQKGMGTLAYRDGWNLFDQIILSHNLLGNEYSTYQFYRSGIFNPDYLLTPSGQFKGYPFRSYDYGGYTGGYSDHFPVYVYLIKAVSVGDNTTTVKKKN